MKEGKRLLADPKFNVLDGSWDDRDFVKYGHALYGVRTQDLYSFYQTIPDGDYPAEIPDDVCDRRFKNRPERAKMRDKEQGVMSGKLFRYRSNPAKVRKLYNWLLNELNEHRRKRGFLGRLKGEDKQFKLDSITTISPTGHKCLWRITEKTRKDNQPVKFPMLAKIDNIDACNFSFKEVLSIAGSMAFDECDMERREYSTLACKMSGKTRSSRKK